MLPGVALHSPIRQFLAWVKYPSIKLKLITNCSKFWTTSSYGILFYLYAISLYGHFFCLTCVFIDIWLVSYIIMPPWRKINPCQYSCLHASQTRQLTIFRASCRIFTPHIWLHLWKLYSVLLLVNMCLQFCTNAVHFGLMDYLHAKYNIEK